MAIVNAMLGPVRMDNRELILRENIDQVDRCWKVLLECILTDYRTHFVYNLYQGLWERMDEESESRKCV